MQHFLESLESATPIVWQASWQAACLAVLVGAVLLVLGGRVAARWRYLLWSLVFVRLALPVVPTSPLSVFRLSQAATVNVTDANDDEPTVSFRGHEGAAYSALPVQPFADHTPAFRAEALTQPPAELASNATTPAQEQADVKVTWTWAQAAALIWFAALIMFLARRAAQQWFLARRAKGWRPCNDLQVSALMNRCCQRLRIRRNVAVFISHDQSGPAIAGVFRPRIVLPQAVLDDCSADQLELILIHELAHVRRHDLLLHEFALFLRAVHWFDPAAWWAYRRLQAEREMACDELVLEISGPDRRQTYGLTLLQIVQNHTRPVLNPGLLGSADPSTRLQRRLVMIRDYQTPSRKSAWLAIGAIVLVSLLGLTRPPTAQTEEPVDQSQSAVETANESTPNRNKSAKEVVTAKRFEIKGRCLDDDGKPVVDAEVWLVYFDRYGAPPAQKWQQKTSRSGEFRFERLEPLADEARQEHFLVAARKPKHTSCLRFVFVGDAAPNFDLTLSTDVGTLSGRVTDENGAPLAGAEVYVSAGTSPLPGFMHDVTNQAGRYSIPDFKCWNAADTERLDPKSGTSYVVSRCYFSVKHPDYPLTRGAYTAIPQEVNVQLNPGITIEGRVVDTVTGKPASDVTVAAQGIKERGWETATTDASGKYRLSLTPDLYNIFVNAKDRTAAALDSFEAPVGKVTKAPDLKLVEGGFIAGKVVEKATGKPFAKLPSGGALRVAHHGPARPTSGAAVDSAVVQSDGTYRLRVAPGPNYPYLMHDVEAERTPRNATSVDPIMVRDGETVTLDFHVSPRAQEEAQEDNGAVTPREPRRTRPLRPAPDKEALLRNIGKPTRERADTEVGRLLNRLDTLRHRMDLDEWAMALRSLIQLGPAAVPELIGEMDATDDEFMLRCLAFAMRGIGDKRAVPALIRALPKTCVSPRSDYGLRAKDPELLAFMQKHDHSDRDDSYEGYHFGRAITEFCSTLQTLTGATHGENEIRSVFLQGATRQQFLQRSQYHRVAQRWADWWEMNWKQHVDDPQYAKVNLPLLSTDKQRTNGFPHGPSVAMEGGAGNCLLESVRNSHAEEVFYDLDTGRISGLPNHLRAAKGQPERLDDIEAWAAREGFDLMGTEYTPPKSEEYHYVLRGLGLTAWQIETYRWDTLRAEIQHQQPFEMGRRTDGLLAHFDATAGRYLPEKTATFLFQTREGGHGAIFVGVEVHDDSLKPGGPSAANDELSPIAFRKGRRFAYSLIAENQDGQKP